MWDEAKHPARRPLRETVEKLQEGVAKVDDEFKVKTSEYAMVKSQLNGLTRKAGGSLATRDLGELVQGTDVRPPCVFFRFDSLLPLTHASLSVNTARGYGEPHHVVRCSAKV